MSATEITEKPAIQKKVKDAQTGKDFDVIPEGRMDVVFAWISAAYSLAVIGFLVWLVLDLRSLQSAAAAAAPASASTDSSILQLAAKLMPIVSGSTGSLIFYTAIGGAIGASVNNLRSFITWHAEERAFGWRFIWKYLAMPPLGGTLAVLVYGILQGGMAVFTGGAAPNTTQVTLLSAWATGTLAGYGSHKVFKWLDDKVNSLFKVEGKQAAVPDVKGKSLEEAKQIVANAELGVGTVSEAPASSDQVGKVIAQTPGAGIQIECGSKVDLTVGVAAPKNDVGTPGATDLTATPQNGNTIRQNGHGHPATVGETSSTTIKETSLAATVVTDAATVAAATTAAGAATGTVVGTDVSVNMENSSVQPSSDDQVIADTSSAAESGETNEAEANTSGETDGVG